MTALIGHRVVEIFGEWGRESSSSRRNNRSSLTVSDSLIFASHWNWNVDELAGENYLHLQDTIYLMEQLTPDNLSELFPRLLDTASEIWGQEVDNVSR